VGVSASDITIDNTTVAAGATVSAGTITVSM
jgi:hypothetical protein